MMLHICDEKCMTSDSCITLEVACRILLLISSSEPKAENSVAIKLALGAIIAVEMSIKAGNTFGDLMRLRTY